MGVRQLICCSGTAPSPAPVPSPSPSPSPSPAPSLAPAPNLRAPDVRFRVLIIGRANAGKTSILQRVCDTTEGAVVYRSGPSGTRCQVELEPTVERGLHNIEDELSFTSHSGYVFHDSRGFEAGSDVELKTVQEFVIRKSRENRLKNRLHAIWYCIPMDSVRPWLDMKYFGDICPDKNVPVIAVFTKFDQFKRNIKIQLEEECRDPETHFETELKRVFDRDYLGSLSEQWPAKHPPFLRLERMHKRGQPCTELIAVTANALSGDVVPLMLLAVQRDNLKLSVKKAVEWTHNVLKREDRSTERVIKACIAAFPSIWYWGHLQSVNNEEFADLDFLRGFNLDDNFFNLNNDSFEFIFNKLTLFYSDRRLCISTGNVTNHTMIVTVLILEYATILYASPFRPTYEDALNMAYSRLISSDSLNETNRLFLLSQIRYSTQPQDLNLTEFLVKHRLR